MIESYLEYQYTPVYSLLSAQLILTASDSSRTKENITTKRIRLARFIARELNCHRQNEEFNSHAQHSMQSK